MEPAIEPASWDVIVVGSGLPECLVASAAVKSGHSVLLLDQEDTYGSEFASMTVGALRQAAAGGVPSLTEPDAAIPAATQRSSADQDGQAEQQGESGGESPSHDVVRLPRFALPLEGVVAYSTPEVANEPTRGFILDLMPKMLYQAEPLVELLVRTQAHHYLEFKRVEGSYLVLPASPALETATSGSGDASNAGPRPPQVQLAPVPASKSDIFRDRSLSLSEKRALMGFLKDAMSAAAGTGPLVDALSSDVPLVEVMRQAGIPPKLRDVVVHGIAMVDAAQEASGQQPQPSIAMVDAAQEASGQQPQPSIAMVDAAQEPSGQQPQPSGTSQSRDDRCVPLSARDGMAALQLLAESLDRHSSPGAFMVPAWGCGSVPEAFVRCCAVAGGTTVLRVQADRALVHWLEEPHARPGCSGRGGGDDARGGAAPAPTSGRCCVEGVVTAGGQVLRCKRLVAGAAIMRALSHARAMRGRDSALEGCADVRASGGGGGGGGGADGPGTGSPLRAAPMGSGGGSGATGNSTCVAATPVTAAGTAPAISGTAPAINGMRHREHRALAIMDAPLVAQTNALTLVVPPRSPLLGGLNTHAVRGLQMGPSLSVCPHGRFLLYLSTPAESDADGGSAASVAGPLCSGAQAALEGAVAALLQTTELRPLGDARSHGGAGARRASQAQGPRGDDGDPRPHALQLFYYTQCAAVPPPAEQLPEGALCPSAGSADTRVDCGLVGHLHAVDAARAVFTSAFPGDAWLSELPDPLAVRAMHEDEADVLDSLEAALSNLAATAAAPQADPGAQEGPGQGGKTETSDASTAPGSGHASAAMGDVPHAPSAKPV